MLIQAIELCAARNTLVGPQLLQLWIGNELLKTVVRTSTGDIRKKHAAGTGRRT